MITTNKRSRELYARARKVIPGGVNSPVRAFGAVGADPIFLASGHGARVEDADGNEYVDHLCSWGPLILGHSPEPVLSAVADAASRGTSFGASTEQEVVLAELIAAHVPSIETVRLVNSGTEATMSALRLARGFTGRGKIVKVEGGYHGHVDYLLVKAGSGATTLGVPDSAGVPPEIAAMTLTIPFNDLESAQALFEQQGEQIAAMIIEPVAGNMGVIPPAPGYLEGLRKVTQKYDSLLIFDEVITGFRVGLSGAQGLYDVTPDLTCLGKVIGGGLPVGAYGGREDIMNEIAPEGPVYQAGTLSGNPLAVAAGLCTLRILEETEPYPELERLAGRLERGVVEATQDAGIDGCFNRVGSMFTSFFTRGPVTDFTSAKTCDTSKFSKYHGNMLKNGVFVAPSQFEAGFISTAHTDADVDFTIEAVRRSLSDL